MRRSLCRRTSWRRPVRTSGEEGAGRGRAARSPGAGRAGRGTGVVSPPLSRRGPPGHSSARGPSRQSPAGPPGQLPWLRPPPGRAPHGSLVPQALTLYGAAIPSPSLLRFPKSGARPGLRAPQAPRRRPGPARDPHPRAGRGRAGEKPPPSAWPRRPIPAEVCRPFASKPTRCRRGRRPGAPLPRRRQTNNFHIGCGQSRGTTVLDLLRTGDLIPKADVLVKRAFSTRGNSV